VRKNPLEATVLGLIMIDVLAGRSIAADTASAVCASNHATRNQLANC
jgi:hypothetical protein